MWSVFDFLISLLLIIFFNYSVKKEIFTIPDDKKGRLIYSGFLSLLMFGLLIPPFNLIVAFFPSSQLKDCVHFLNDVTFNCPSNYKFNFVIYLAIFFISSLIWSWRLKRMKKNQSASTKKE